MYNIKKELEKFNEILDSLDETDSPASEKEKDKAPDARTDRPAQPSANLAADRSTPSDRAAVEAPAYGVYSGPTSHKPPRKVIERSPANPSQPGGRSGENAATLPPDSRAGQGTPDRTASQQHSRTAVKPSAASLPDAASPSAAGDGQNVSPTRPQQSRTQTPPIDARRPEANRIPEGSSRGNETRRPAGTLQPPSRPVSRASSPSDVSPLNKHLSPSNKPVSADRDRLSKPPWSGSVPNRSASEQSNKSTTGDASGSSRRPIVPIPPNPLVPSRPAAPGPLDTASLRKVRMPESRSSLPKGIEDRHRDLDALIDDLRGSLSRPSSPLREANPVVRARTVDPRNRPTVTVEPIRQTKRRPTLMLVAASVAVIVPVVLGTVLLLNNASESGVPEFASSASVSGSAQPTLTVTTEPRGAKVYLNSQLVGVTPFEGVKVEPGDYVMTTELDGFVQNDTVLSIRGASTLAFALNPSGQSGFGDDSGHILAGLEEPLDAETTVQSDGTDLDATDIVKPEADPSSDDRTEASEPEANRNRSEAANSRTPRNGQAAPSGATSERASRPVVGSASLTSEPAGATVWLDGASVGETPITLKDLADGTYRLQFTRPNYETYETDLRVTAGMVTPMNAKLAPVVGTIVVNVQPEGEVYIDGELQGRGVTGMSRFEVAPGAHNVRVESSEYGVRELPIDVRPGRESELTVDFAADGVGQLLSEADALFDRGEFQLAKEMYERAATLAPRNTRVVGKLAEIQRLLDAQLEQEAQEAIIEDGVYLVVDTPPQLIGGLEALHKTVRYPEAAFRAGVEGRVYIQFVVDEQGNPSDLRVSKGLPLGCNEAAMDAIRKAKFIPGEFKGRTVKVRHTLFINFRK